MKRSDRTAMLGRIATLETILTCLVWRWAQTQDGASIVEALGSVMVNAETNLGKGRDKAVGVEEREIAEAALDSFKHLSRQLMGNALEDLPDRSPN